MKNRYKELETKIIKFQQHLRNHKNGSDKTHANLDSELALIREEVKEFPMRGIHKQEELVHKHYVEYIKDGSDEHYSAIEHDITTLLDFLKEHESN